MHIRISVSQQSCRSVGPCGVTAHLAALLGPPTITAGTHTGIEIPRKQRWAIHGAYLRPRTAHRCLPVTSMPGRCQDRWRGTQKRNPLGGDTAWPHAPAALPEYRRAAVHWAGRAQRGAATTCHSGSRASHINHVIASPAAMPCISTCHIGEATRLSGGAHFRWQEQA